MPDIPRRQKLLDKQLARLPEGSEPMLISELDGFVAGILVCPDLVMPGEWLQMVWCGGGEGATPVFENARQVEELAGLIMEHYNAVADDIRRSQYVPVFDVEPGTGDILWEIWIDGFAPGLSAHWVDILSAWRFDGDFAD